jgi:hypothetical protein
MTPKTTIIAIGAAGVLALGAGTALSCDAAPKAATATQVGGAHGARAGTGGGHGQRQRGQGRGGQSQGGSESTTLKLSNSAKRELLYMREEEKVAADVYATLAKRYPDAPFAQIATSETKHEGAIQRQLDRAGLADPTVGNAVGEFENDELQSMYDALVARGSRSLPEALTVAALIEETDIDDLRASAKTTKDAQLRRVYANLERASGQHLRIFVGALNDSGVTYQPSVLSRASYNRVLDASMR